MFSEPEPSADKLSLGANLKPCPFCPATKVVPVSVPLLRERESSALLSAIYHETKPMGAGAQVCAKADATFANAKTKIAKLRLVNFFISLNSFRLTKIFLRGAFR